MGKWKDNNLSEMIEYPFDSIRYIEEQLRNIADLEERAFAKEVLLNGLGGAISGVEAKYQALERRIYEELELPGCRYDVTTTIVRREHYEAINRTLFPVTETDLNPEKSSKEWGTEQEIYSSTIFLKVSEMELQNLNDGFELPALWQREGEAVTVTVHIIPAKRYRSEIEKLYQTFEDNRITWETVHVGFLERFFDVFVSRVSIPKRTLADQEIHTISLTSLEIQWEEMKIGSCVEFDMIPLWNIKRVSVDSERFKEATVEGVFYEHDIAIKGRLESDGYLIEKNRDILEIRHEAKKIVVTSPQEEFHGWKVLHFIQEKPIRSLDYQEVFLTNHRRDTFLGRFAAHNRTENRLRTKAELFRRIMDLDIRDYIKIKEYEIYEEMPDVPMPEGMDWFIKEELIPQNMRRILLLRFEALKPDHYLTDSMINFAVSSLQLEFAEFHLVGVRV